VWSAPRLMRLARRSVAVSPQPQRV
jgi:hypothetical protein